MSPVVEQTFQTMGTWDDTVFWQRIESRSLTGRQGYAQAYVLTGPAGCGKSKLILRVPQVLGQKYSNLGGTLPQTYLTNDSERDGNASMPATNKLQGKRHVTCKEVTGKKGIRAHLLKGILDQTDVPVDARANNSAQRADTTFPVVWTLVWAQNGDLRMNSNGDAAVVDKVVELRPPFIFVADPKVGTNERRTRSDLKDLNHYTRPEWVLEMVLLAGIFDKLNGTDMCPDRRLEPIPPLSVAYTAKWADAVRLDVVGEAATRLLEHCERKDATPADEVIAVLMDETGVDCSVLTAAGYGASAQSVRRSGGRAGGLGCTRDRIFIIPLDTVEPRPVRLRGARL